MTPTTPNDQNILQAAATEASRLGLEAVTFGHLALALEMSKASLHTRYGSKAAMQLAIIEHVVKVFSGKVLRPALKAPRGVPRLQALFDHWLAWIAQNPFGEGCFFFTVSAEMRGRQGPVRQHLVAQMADVQQLVADVVQTAITEGHFSRAVEPQGVAYEFMGILLAYHHAYHLLAAPQAETWARRAFARLITLNS